MTLVQRQAHRTASWGYVAAAVAWFVSAIVAPTAAGVIASLISMGVSASLASVYRRLS